MMPAARKYQRAFHALRRAVVVTETVTGGIRISVRTAFVPERSNPRDSYYVFAYEVTIANDGPEPARLLTRHWVITDAEGNVEEVVGDGVVGETPYLEPGEHFTYTSFCPLRTETGTMHGTYGMVRPNGARFDAAIPRFTLSEPYTIN
jgi:ApaG protein